MKKVLIICDYFPPSTEIGAVRPSKIAKYLTQDGYEVDVFTKYPVDEKNAHICSKVYSYDSNGTIEEVPEKNGGGFFDVLKKWDSLRLVLSKFKLTVIDVKNAARMLKHFKQFVEQQEDKYDVVISTFGPFGCLLCGNYYKKKNPSVNWICDFRDPTVVDVIPFYKKIYLKRLERVCCRRANHVVAVSEGYLERICNGKFTDKSHMIPNGFDMDDKCVLNSGNSSEKLEFCYVGKLYRGVRDVSPIFDAIRELCDEGIVDADKISFSYAGREYNVLCEQAEKYDMQSILVNRGLLKREDCLKLQFESDLLVLANWNTRKEYGVFPGKFIEYMLIGKPIVAITYGEMPECEITRVMKEGNLGVSWEEVTGERDFAFLKEYIKKQYDNVINGSKAEFSPESQVVDRYNYTNIIKKIEALIEND